MVSFLDRPATVALAGRTLVAACGLAAPVFIYLAAYRATRGDRMASAIAGAAVALNPILISESVTFRPYGFFAAVEAARLLYLCRVAGASDKRDARVFSVLTALLPWTHYAAFPVLAFEALALWLFVPNVRRLLGAYVVATIAAIPLLVAIFVWRIRIPPVSDPLGRASFVWLAGLMPLPVVAVCLLAIAVVCGLRATEVAQRAAVAHSLALAAAVTFLSLRDQVRPSAAALGAPSLGLLFGVLAVFGAPKARRWVRLAVGGAALGTLPFQFDAEGYPISLPRPEGRDLEALAAEAKREVAPNEWHVFPSWDVSVIAFDIEAMGGSTTKLSESSFHSGAVLVTGTDSLEPPPSGRVIVFSCERAPSGCRLVGGNRCSRRYECP
jgi:hypothetical protein